jgi:hypothetical protein
MKHIAENFTAITMTHSLQSRLFSNRDSLKVVGEQDPFQNAVRITSARSASDRGKRRNLQAASLLLINAMQGGRVLSAQSEVTLLQALFLCKYITMSG